MSSRFFANRAAGARQSIVLLDGKPLIVRGGLSGTRFSVRRRGVPGWFGVRETLAVRLCADRVAAGSAGVPNEYRRVNLPVPGEHSPSRACVRCGAPDGSTGFTSDWRFLMPIRRYAHYRRCSKIGPDDRTTRKGTPETAVPSSASGWCRGGDLEHPGEPRAELMRCFLQPPAQIVRIHPAVRRDLGRVGLRGSVIE